MKARSSFANRAQFEGLEIRRLLSAAANKVIGDSVYENDDHDGLSVMFLPQSTVVQELGKFVTGKQAGRRADVARSFFVDRATDLGISPADAQAVQITSQYTDADTGVTHVYLQQHVNGLPVQNATAAIHIGPGGRVISASSRFVPGAGALAEAQRAAASQGVDPLSPSHMIHPTHALRAAASALGVASSGAPQLSYVGGTQREYQAIDAELSFDEIPLRAQYIVTEEGIRLAWQTVLRLTDGSDNWYDMSVDASSGELILCSNWTDHLASYNIFDRPVEAPNDGSRSIVTDPWDSTASPFGWHDTDGDIDPDFTDTRGNNVRAQEDADANNTGGARPDGGPSLNFDFPYNGALAPINNLNAATTNLFYWNNIIHDVTYAYGFNEAAGNFQTNNYGRGGVGNDAVNADSQDGSGTNNANFSTPPDGTPGRMQMFIWTTPNPDADSSFDNGIIVHEYGHGISNRLTGGPADASALSAVQSGGMGEGWSDFLGLMFTQKASDTQDGGYGIGTYVRGQPNTGLGIRRKPYSFDKTINPLTTEVFGIGGSVTYPGHAPITRSTQVHATGEIWASALWDMNWLLINKFGFDGNLQTGYNATGTTAERAGNKLALQLVLDGMKLQPANPTLADARDAILQADIIRSGGANQNEIWQAFARRGMGLSFFSGRSAIFTEVTPAFDLPSSSPAILGAFTQSTFVAPPSTLALRFTKSMDTASFSPAADILSFTGPAGQNLLSDVTGFTWSADARTLTITFTPQAQLGSYSLTVAPTILAADNASLLDQNLNGIPGEAGDSFTASFNHTSLLGPDAGGYLAGQWAFENINLQPGDSGVTSILTNIDDAGTAINLGDNTFTFYDVTYASEANAVVASTNGFVSFGAVSTVALNTDLTSPLAPRIAGLWDDFTTTRDADDQILFTFQDLNNDGINDRLIVEWNEVGHFDNPANGGTWQVIMQLNTSGPGTAIVNYVDVNFADPRFDNGASATVGLKANGSPPTSRLLVSAQDGDFPWIGSGKAIRFSHDWIAPTANAAFAFETAQQLGYTFSENVSMSLTTADLSVVNHTTAAAVPSGNLSLSYNAGSNVATIGFPGLTPLPDGNYTATLAAAGVTDPSWMPLAGDNVLNFFVLAGDATRDRSVNLNDFTVLAANFGASNRVFSQGDFDYSGNVDLNDFTVLASQFGKSLPAPGDAPRSGSEVMRGPLPLTSVARHSNPFSDDRVADDVL